ncbi:MAG: CapA family protein [Acidobacteria bacterium]|nr:CapA family protein [Acidobacteriota bacterium]
MKLLFVGDVMLGRLVNEVLKRESPQYPWGDTLSIFQEADWRACNLECVISNRGTPWSQSPKIFHFRSDAKNVAVLESAGLDTVFLANNHTLDYGYEALLETLALLDKAGIKYAGAGIDASEASRPCVIQVNGMEIGFLALTDNEPAWEATQDRAGVYHVPIDPDDTRARRLFESVRQTKISTDLLIVSTHWGPNSGYWPQPNHMPFARALIDHGADIVFGHSCHVFQGIEIYRSRPIVYSAGNFIDDYAVDPVERNDHSFIFMFEIDGSRIRYIQLYPTVIRDFQARLATESEAEQITARMHALCLGFGTQAQWHLEQRYLEIKLNDATRSGGAHEAAERKTKPERQAERA